MVLLHAPYAAATSWGDLPEMLRSYGMDVIAPDVADAAGPRYVARASLIIAATAPSAPLVLVGHGAAGPILPGIAVAQQAAHRKVGGYVFVDAELPRPARPDSHDHDHDGDPGPDEREVAGPADWPDAPCAYLATDLDERAQEIRQARLRGWPVAEHEPPIAVAQSLSELITTL
ncbi:hypothetical protein J4573_19125 [Actinomadura barringtoniae]|uniref:Alpha/beta hydrolase n=1 Tax=Actinomadura barringtoniae TaxID=1427535 RepID=A0A939PAX8_9ACTN|nr:hypothetical protein [Actinomadura barringtoniae]